MDATAVAVSPRPNPHARRSPRPPPKLDKAVLLGPTPPTVVGSFGPHPSAKDDARTAPRVYPGHEAATVGAPSVSAPGSGSHRGPSSYCLKEIYASVFSGP